MPPQPIHTVVMYPRPHPDNIVALYLLREFGEQHFPGIRQAQLQFWPTLPPGKSADDWERDGVLMIDIGGGRFDHHHEEHSNDKTTCATTLVARFLGVDQQPELKKLLEYVRRDDLEGKGILSKDPIDRAFGLSAVIMNLNRDYPDHPEYVVDVVTRIFAAHYHEEYRRKVLMPREWEALQQNGLASQFTVQTPARPLKVVMVQSDEKALVGYLRAVGAVQADVVVQRLTTGHVNVVTRQVEPHLNLRQAVAAIRRAEAAKKGVDISGLSAEQLEKPRRLEGVEEWYYDTAAETIQNGGAAAAEFGPTRLTGDEIRQILEQTLPSSVAVPERRPDRFADRPNRPPRDGAAQGDEPRFTNGGGPHVIRFADLRRRPRKPAPDDQDSSRIP